MTNNPYPKREPLEDEIYCSYDNIAYNRVPGYVPGYGCPVCKATGIYHLPIARGISDHRITGDEMIEVLKKCATR